MSLIALNILLAVVLASRLMFAIPFSALGGLDGCLSTSTGAPIVTTVRVGQQTATTDAEGCFFFASLVPGQQTLEIDLAVGVWQRPVTIIAGKAVGLGDMTVESAEMKK